MKREDFIKITKEHIKIAKMIIESGCSNSFCIYCPLSSTNASNDKSCGVNYGVDRIITAKQFLELFDIEPKSLNFYERLSATLYKKQILFKQDDGIYYNQRLDETMSKSDMKEWLLADVGEWVHND